MYVCLQLKIYGCSDSPRIIVTGVLKLNVWLQISSVFTSSDHVVHSHSDKAAIYYTATSLAPCPHLCLLQYIFTSLERPTHFLSILSQFPPLPMFIPPAVVDGLVVFLDSSPSSSSPLLSHSSTSAVSITPLSPPTLLYWISEPS